ncbi:DNA-directed RNA polymerase [Geopyxis carbonaria]|nr:DNA-directed RNA polymerase [Geopyxis carbonaria]
MPSAAADSRRNIVGVNAETVTNVTSTDFPGHWPGEEAAWDLPQFRRTFRVDFHRNAPLHAEFDLVHLDASVANAFRRIMMAEVATFAIEYVYVLNNTSVIQDEVLAHRLGLVPLCGDREQLKRMKWFRKAPGVEPTVEDTLVFDLTMACERRPDAPRGSTNPDELYVNHSVYARDIKFVPAGTQEARFAADPPRAANPDILLAKMRPGQELALQLHAIKGFGKDHAKFSPVATASYRLLPDIQILEPIRGKAAERFAACFPAGVVAVEDGEARVANARNDTVSREVLRHEEFRGKVKLGRVRDHFIFSVESSGQLDADEIFLEAVGVLQAKCARMKRHTLMMLQLQEEEAERAVPEAGVDAMEE